MKEKKEKKETKEKQEKDTMLDVAMAQMGEDATGYGEFIPSYFTWVTPEEQRKTVERLENITKKKQ